MKCLLHSSISMCNYAHENIKVFTFCLLFLPSPGCNIMIVPDESDINSL